MLGPLLAFTTLLTWTLSDLIVRHALSKQSIWFLSFWGQLFGGAGILIIGFLLGEIETISIKSAGWIALFSTVNTFGMFFFYKAIQRKGVALSLPIIYSWSIPAILLSMIFLDQKPSSLQWLGITTILFGLFCVTVDRHSKHWMDSGSLAALISMLTWGFFYFSIAKPSELYGEWWLGGTLKLGTALLSLPFLIHEKINIPIQRKNILWAMGLIGLLDALGLVALSTGLQISSTAVMTGITSTTPVIVALFGIFLFKERVNRQQALGIVSTVVGLILLVL